MEHENLLQNSKKIHLLPEHIIDQIKAGEVLERPASLLKELIENSLDAKSTRIDIHLINNGLDLLSISDNGEGIIFEDLPFAFLRHATSKISTFDDLYKLYSFGFRGEALASIASSSRLTCLSRSLKGSHAGKIVIHGGKQKFYGEIHQEDQGTSFFIKDLFYNTPVRLKFVKSKNSEQKAIKKIFESYVLANPSCYFSIKWDEHSKQIFQPIDEHSSKRIEELFFNKSSETHELKKIHREYDDHQIEGYFSTMATKGYSQKKQFLFINGRPFEDRSLHQSILRHLLPLWEMGHSGHYCFFIKAPPKFIDVNVHPNKTVIKFLKESLVHSLIGAAIKEVFTSLPKKEKIEPHSFAERDTPSYIEEETEIHEFKTIQYFERNFWLLEKNSRFFILNGNLFLKNFLEDNWISKAPYSEQTSIPLLISEPFSPYSPNVDSFLPLLATYGLEFDRLDQSTLVLRTIPQEMNLLPYVPIISLLLNSFHQQKKINISLFLQEEFCKNFTAKIPWNFLSNALKDHQFWGIMPNFIQELSSSSFEKFFKD